MTDLSSLIEVEIQTLQRALDNHEEEQIDRTVSSLERNLLLNSNFKQIGNERILENVLQLLNQFYGKENKDRLNELFGWLEIIQDINEKFYAILNHEIDLDELLLSKLAFWKCANKTTDCNFDEGIKQKLKQAREKNSTEEKIQSFLFLYFDYITQNTLEFDLSEPKRNTELVLNCLRRFKEQWNVQALFSLGNTGAVYGIKVKARSGGNGKISALSQIDLEMEKAAKGCFEFVKDKYSATTTIDITWDIQRGDIPFAGNSIGLALALGILSSIEGFEIDPYTAFTGKVEWHTGKVQAVGDLDVKLKAAKASGIRRVFVPSESEHEIITIPGLDIVIVESIDDAKTQLINKVYINSSANLERRAEIILKQIEIELGPKGVKARGGIQDYANYKRLTFTNFNDEIFVDVYFGKHGNKIIVQPKNCLLKNIVQTVCDNLYEKKDGTETEISKKRDKYIVNDKSIQKNIESFVFNMLYSTKEEEQNCLYRAKILKNGCIVYIRQFNKGTLTIDGQEPLFQEINNGIRAILGIDASFSSISTSESKLDRQIEAVMSIELGEQWIGTDEAGKGDYFGPLVGAAVFINKDLADKLTKIGVKDSKKLSDNRNLELASKIINICGKRAQVVLITPSRYNQLYQEFKQEGKNLNTLLAWVHTRALEDILTTFPQDQVTVIIDKFADEKYIKNKLLENTRRSKLNLVQLPKAEANTAVAAASILARAQFLNWLVQTSHQLQISLPKGASDPNIPQIAQQIIKKYGREKLAEVAKMHFKTTKDILS